MSESVVVQGTFGRVATHATQRALVEHAHLEFNFIFWIGGSTTGFKVGKSQYVLDESHAILVNPWMPHAKLASDDGPTLVLTVLPNSQWLADVLGLVDLPLVRFFSQPCVGVSPEVRSRADRLAATMNAGTAFGASAYEPMVRDLVVAATEAYADPDMRTTFFRRDRPMDARISRSLGFIREAAAENPNLDEIASKAGLSRSRFFEQFKACIGASPQQYLDWARMSLATRMLASTEMSVADVSHELGFSAPSHFTRFFSQHMGVPPSDFKRAVIIEGDSDGAQQPVQ